MRDGPRPTRIFTGIGHDLNLIKAAIFEFLHELAAFQQHACREPCETTLHGQRAFVLMSAEHYDWIRAAGRRPYRTSSTTTVVINTVKQARRHSGRW
jgi:hypothetical protein